MRWILVPVLFLGACSNPVLSGAGAQQQVQAYINHRFSVCEGDHLTTSFSSVIIGGGRVVSGYFPRDYRGLRPNLASIALTEAEKLNNITYRGQLTFQWTAVRYWKDEHWSDWAPATGDDPQPVLLQERGGTWTFEGGPLSNFRGTDSCAELPPVDPAKVAAYVARMRARAEEEKLRKAKAEYADMCDSFFVVAPKRSGLNLRPTDSDEVPTGGLKVRNMDWNGCRSRVGETPLIIAAKYWQVRDAAAVLQRAASTASIRDNSGRTAADYATARVRQQQLILDRDSLVEWMRFITDAGGSPPSDVAIPPRKVTVTQETAKAIMISDPALYYTPVPKRYGRVNTLAITVQVKFSITTRGDVVNARSTQTEHPGDAPPEAVKAAIETISQWKFKPPVIHGEAVEMNVLWVGRVRPNLPRR